jgi:hypothetical protein
MPVRKLIWPFDRSLYPGPQYAGFCERLRYDFLQQALRVGWDDERHGPIVSGISEAQARKSVAKARYFGFLPNPRDEFYVET